MKNISILFICVVFSCSLFAAEPTQAQKQAIFMMNYAQYVTYKLKTYNNIIALEEEYENLNGNMNFETIHDYNSVDTINNLANAIYNERKNHKNRERLEASIEKSMNQALYNSIPPVTTIVTGSLNPLSIAINTARTAGNIFVSYQQYKNKLSDEYDEKMFQLQTLTEDNLNSLYQDLNIYTYDLVQKYKLSDEWRLNKKELEEMFKYIKDTNEKRIYANLKNMSEGRYVQHFPMFWYHLAKAAAQTGDEQAALNYYDRFEKENIEIFRYDRTAVDAYKGKIAILLKNQKTNRNEIIRKLKFIETNKTSWNDYYFCALVYAQLNDTENAKRLLVRNINELSAEVDNQFLDVKNLQKVYDASDLSVRNYYDGLELSRALLKRVGDKTVSVTSIEQQYRNDTQAVNEVLYWFGLQSSSSLVQGAINDIKKVQSTIIVFSPKVCQINAKIPLQWVMSSNTELVAVFYREGRTEPLEISMSIDEKESKKLKKFAKTVKNCDLVYTTGKQKVDWKTEGYYFGGIVLKHTLYPIEFNYEVDLNDSVKLLNSMKNRIPVSVIFNGKAYVIEE
mgnify:CR=1 FL=1